MATADRAIRGVTPRPGALEYLWSWITTVDHKRIGIMYGITAFAFFLLGGLEALLIRIQLAGPNGQFLSPEAYNQLFTMHGTTMIFQVVMPLSAAFFNLVVPLQIGARDVAFPRLNAFSYWTFLFGSVLLNLGWFWGQAPDAGWFAYANLTSRQYSPSLGMDFWVMGLTVLGTSSMASAFNFLVTIITMRAPGMSLMRMPVFTWMTMVVSFLIIFSFPPITVAVIELMFDRLFGTNFFNPAAGGQPILWQHLFWIFGHPEVYILVLPAMGVVSEVIPTFARKPLFGYPFVVFSGIFIGFLGWGVWAHHMFAVGMGPIANSVFALSTMLIAIPTGVKIFNWLGTLWRGHLNMKSPLYFALGMVALFIIGGLSGVMHSSAPSDYQQTDTYFVVAHFHYVLFGGSIFGLFAGVYYWWPKYTGRLLNEGLGKLHFWLMFLGMNLAFGPMHVLGISGMPRRTYTYPPGMGWEFWNLVVSVGAFVIGFSVLVFLYNALRSLKHGEVAGNDPWDGRTLEWTIPSPPPEYNFAVIPTAIGRDTFWLQKYGTGGHGPLSAMGSGQAHSEAGSHDHIHMPKPSFYPVVFALGMTVALGALIFYAWPLVALGALITLLGVYGWAFEPAS
jgi:cytochrome c oxidase subunit 1